MTAPTLCPIIETVVTTLNPDGSVNCGAMGVEWGTQQIVIKPYRGTRTLRNLRATMAGVVNLTDDMLLFSQAALGDPHPPTHPAAGVEGAVLDDACSWREVRVEAIDDGGPRARVSTVVVGSGIGREFLGLNRARHAVPLAEDEGECQQAEERGVRWKQRVLRFVHRNESELGDDDGQDGDEEAPHTGVVFQRTAERRGGAR